MRRVLLALGAVSLLLAPAALAQERKRATPTSPSASTWVKLCETPKVSGKDLLGKAQAAGVTTCLILAERLDATTGARLLAVGIRQSEGRQTLTVVVPSRVDQRGMIVVIYSRSQWKRAERGELIEKRERDRMKPLKLEYTSCDAEQCAAETDATP
jgi:invasion protein IalB